jgi:hypothetical protein
MKLAVLGGVALVCATMAVVVAQGQATAPQVQTVIGCVKGEGTTQSPWLLAGVVIPPPAAAPAGRGGRGAGGGGGRGGGAGAPGGAPAGGPPAAAPAPAPPPPPPPPPIDLRITGLDMGPWRGYRAQVEGTMGAGTPREFKANTARSVWGVCPNN